MAEFDPSTANVGEVLEQLEKADEKERKRILKAELKGKSRKSILEEYNVDPNERTDADGRVLYPWELEGKDHVRPVEVEESDEQRKAREAQAEFDQQVAAAAPSGVDEQQGGTAAGVGVTGGPAAGTATAGAVGTAGI